MKAVGKELKWALGGFIGGFVLCYILIGVLNQPHHAQTFRAHIPLGASTAPTMVIVDQRTAIPQSDVPHAIRASTLKPSTLRNVPSGTLPETYSVDLIDGRDLPPAGD